MKKALFYLFTLISLSASAQWEAVGVGSDQDSTYIIYNLYYSYPPGEQQKQVVYLKDTTSIRFNSENAYFKVLDQSRWEGKPNSILWAGSDGKIKASSIDHLFKTYNGQTDSSGEYTVIFPSSYTTVPFVKASIPNQSSPNQFVRVSSVNQTGFTVNAYGFDTLGNALQIDTTPLQSLTISVFVAE